MRFKNRFGFRWTVFGFYWLKAMEPSVMDLLFKRESQERLLELYVACTVGMLRIVYGHNAMLLRREWLFTFPPMDCFDTLIKTYFNQLDLIIDVITWIFSFGPSVR